jgi:hypothetical protein
MQSSVSDYQPSQLICRNQKTDNSIDIASVPSSVVNAPRSIAFILMQPGNREYYERREDDGRFIFSNFLSLMDWRLSSDAREPLDSFHDRLNMEHRSSA